VALTTIAWLGYKALGGVWNKGDKKPKDGDPEHGEIQFDDYKIGKNWTHSAALESMMVAADAHRAYEAAGGGVRGTGAALYRSVTDLLNDLPFVQGPKKLIEGLESQKAAERFVGNDMIGGLVPPDVRKYAKAQDTKPGAKEPTRRYPQGIIDYAKMNVPGLREQVSIHRKPKEPRP